MIQPIMYVILAPSRSGKDSLAKLMMQYMPKGSCTLFKWADHVKRVVETTYGLNKGDLENDTIRNATIPGTNTTYLQMLVDFYHNQDRLSDSFFWKRPSLATLSATLRDVTQHIISTDTRDIFEADAIAEMLPNSNYKLVLVKLHREQNKGLSSDLLLDRNVATLTPYAYKYLPVTVPNKDDYKAHLVPLAMQLVELAS